MATINKFIELTQSKNEIAGSKARKIKVNVAMLTFTMISTLSLVIEQ